MATSMRIEDVILPETHGESAIAAVEKRLSARARNEPEATMHLRQEAFLLGALGGRVTPRLLAAGDDEHGPWLRMEKLAFPTLARRLEDARGAPLDRSWVERATLAAFTALAELHEASDADGPLHVVHADISPANLAVDDEGARVVLLDLELSCWRGSPARDGAFRGTIGYSAPEIARGETPTIASDLFALAAAMLHASTGVVPRDGASLAAVIAVAAERPLLDDPRVASAHLPEAIVQCLAHDAAARPAAARAVVAALRSGAGWSVDQPF
jgi:eukaryotic-like serine/threonine-protein kinase